MQDNDEPCKPKESESEQKMYYFGIGSWHPKWLQVFASKNFFTFLLCVFGVVEGALISGNVPSIQQIDYIH